MEAMKCGSIGESRKEKSTNEKVFQRMECELEILLNVKRRKIEYIGHNMRN